MQGDSAMTFKTDWARAKKAYKLAPHGFRRSTLKTLQKLVADQLKRELAK